MKNSFESINQDSIINTFNGIRDIINRVLAAEGKEPIEAGNVNVVSSGGGSGNNSYNSYYNNGNGGYTSGSVVFEFKDTTLHGAFRGRF
jgi:tripartite-type tricarboxylate transporter receptor subunit TctC